MTAQVVLDDTAGRAAAIEILRGGGVVAVPTDTVYGLAVAVATPRGVERLFEVKRRPPDKGILMLLDSPSQAGDVGVMTEASAALAAACWPGGLSMVLARRPGVDLPEALTAGGDTIGVRVPDHDAPRALARALGPLPTTSANVSGLPELPDADAIVERFGAGIDLVLDGGPAAGGPPSTVVDCSIDRPHLIRAGAIDVHRLSAILDAAGIAHELG
jgi:L-threonylcarbamoyladenylate synthase